MKLIRHIAIVGFFALVACSEEVKVEPYSYQKKFTGETKKSWTIRSVQYLKTGKTTQTFTLDACVLDDLYVFYNNFERTMQVIEGSKPCNEGDPDIIADTNWSFSNATGTLNMPMPLLTSAPYQPIPFILKEIDATKMVVDIYLEDGSAYRFNFKVASEE